MGDNASVNRLLANRIKELLRNNKNISREAPLIRCASHKLNLAIQGLYSVGTPAFLAVVEKVHKLMIELGTLTSRMKLRTRTHLTPIKRNDTRWGSVFMMVRRYLKICKDLSFCNFSRSTRAMFSSNEDHYIIEELEQILYTCGRTSIFYKMKMP